jgi:hypothetical protein
MKKLSFSVRSSKISCVGQGASALYISCTEAEFLDEIQTKVLVAIHSHLYSIALRFLFLQTHATSYNFYSTL